MKTLEEFQKLNESTSLGKFPFGTPDGKQIELTEFSLGAGKV